MLSIDGGQTTQAIGYSANEQIIDPSDGSVIYIDTTNIRLAESEHLEFPGTGSAFQTLVALRDDILNGRSLEQSARNDAVQRRLGDLERLEDHLLDELGVQSVSLAQMDRLEIRTEDLELDQRVKYGETTSADVA